MEREKIWKEWKVVTTMFKNEPHISLEDWMVRVIDERLKENPSVKRVQLTGTIFAIKISEKEN